MDQGSCNKCKTQLSILEGIGLDNQGNVGVQVIRTTGRDSDDAVPQTYACAMQSVGERGIQAPATATQVVDSVLSTTMAIGRLMRQRLAGDQLEPATYWVLKNLLPGSVRITALAASTQLDTSTVSRHVTQLEQAGLVERSQDPDDRRAQRVELTEKGRSQLAASTARRRELLTRSLDGWDPADLADLERLLDRFATSIESRDR